MAHRTRSNGTPSDLGEGNSPAQSHSDDPEQTQAYQKAWSAVAVELLGYASEAAKESAAAKPDEKGYPIVGIVYDHDGNIVVKDGAPLIIPLPIRAVGLDEGPGVHIKYEDMPDRLVPPKEAAKQLGVSNSTLKREETKGFVPGKMKASTRKTGWLQSDLSRIKLAGGIDGLRARSEKSSKRRKR